MSNTFTSIEAIIFGQSKSENIKITLPEVSLEKNRLTIIAGRNRTGKSHLLRYTKQSIATHNKNLRRKKNYKGEYGSNVCNVLVQPVDPLLPFGKCFLFQDASFVDKFQHLNTAVNSRQKSMIEKDAVYIKTEFVKNQVTNAKSLSEVREGYSQEALENCFNNQNSNFECLKILENSKNIYLADNESCAATRTFEQMVSAKLYLQYDSKAKALDPLLWYDNDEVFSFGGEIGGWSQGQKVAFVLLLTAEYLRPEILLIDELENHLHPLYISRICQFLKERIAESIIVTHHPHLIFSQFPNSVWFMDLQAVNKEAEQIVVMTTQEARDRPFSTRSITPLNSDYDRISSTYNLFDSYDHQLLTLASTLKDQLAVEFLKQIESGLKLEVVDVSPKTSPDRQSLQLSDTISSVIKNKNGELTEILDYGAGVGRTFKEMEKNESFKEQQISWTFYEPDQKYFLKLAEEYPANTLSTLENIEKNFDIILLVNVLHECSPVQIATVLQNCKKFLRQNGVLLIAELFPLLSPERFGIAYSIENMEAILSECKFTGTSNYIHIRSATVKAYTTTAKPQPGEVSVEESSQKIRDNVWTKIKNQNLLEYSSSLEKGSVRYAATLASQLHVIASIDAYDMGQWQSDF
jgi:ABC-type cobalamin/Fe3+-siderophores transport system ATPase subunit/SAM-dependent methyltransferase